jgi:hypothetical protein
MVYLPLACTPGKSLEPAFVIRTVPCNDTYLPTYLPTGDHSCSAGDSFDLLLVDYFTTMDLFPEELLERALAHAVVTPASPHPRALWHSSAIVICALFK